MFLNSSDAIVLKIRIIEITSSEYICSCTSLIYFQKLLQFIFLSAILYCIFNSMIFYIFLLIFTCLNSSFLLTHTLSKLVIKNHYHFVVFLSLQMISYLILQSV